MTDWRESKTSGIIHLSLIVVAGQRAESDSIQLHGSGVHSRPAYNLINWASESTGQQPAPKL